MIKTETSVRLIELRGTHSKIEEHEVKFTRKTRHTLTNLSELIKCRANQGQPTRFNLALKTRLPKTNRLFIPIECKNPRLGKFFQQRSWMTSPTVRTGPLAWRKISITESRKTGVCSWETTAPPLFSGL
jgi:hypothetical protein